MKIHVSTVYKACIEQCRTVDDLEALLKTIDGGLQFLEFAKSQLTDTNSVINCSNYQIVEAICNIINGKPSKLFSEPEFTFRETKHLYSTEMYASINYLKANGFGMAEFYRNLRYTEDKLAQILQDLKDEVVVVPYAHNYSDPVGLCILHYTKLTLKGENS